MYVHQLNEALDAFEKNAEGKIEECYKKFLANVKETINSLIASSSEIATNILKNDVAELKMMIEIAGIETTIDKAVGKETIEKASSNKYLIVKPMNELTEQVKDPGLQNLPELRNLQSVYQSNHKTNESFTSEMAQNLNSDEINPENDISTFTTIKKKTKQKRKNNTVTTKIKALFDNAQLLESCNVLQITARVKSVRDDDNRLVYQCLGCTYKSYESTCALNHFEQKHNTKNCILLTGFKCSKCNYSANTPMLLKTHEDAAHNKS